MVAVAKPSYLSSQESNEQRRSANIERQMANKNKVKAKQIMDVVDKTKQAINQSNSIQASWFDISLLFCTVLVHFWQCCSLILLTKEQKEKLH